MIPKVDFQIHEVLIQAFFSPKMYGGDRSFLDSKLNEFIEGYRMHEEKILKLIEKYSGFEWSKDRIPVFLVPDNFALFYSFAKPILQDALPGVVLKIRPNGKIRDFWIFIHELSHINQYHSDFYTPQYGAIDENNNKNVDRVEVCADLLALYVLRDLFGEDSEYEKDFWDFLENTNEKNKKKFEQMKKHLPIWDLKKNTLKNYLLI